MIKQPELGKKISELRKAKGWTQEELVEKCNVSVRTLQRIETGDVVPRTYTVKIILAALDQEFESLVTANGSLSGEEKTVQDESITTSRKLTTAWIFGAIHFLFMFLYVPAEYHRLDGEMLFSPSIYIAIHMIVLLSYLYFQMGFVTLAEIFDNYLLKISAILLMTSYTLITVFNITSLYVDVDRISIMFGITVLLGALGIVYGIALRRLGQALGRAPKFAAGFEILSGCFFLTVVLVFIGDFLHIAAEIFGIVTMYKAAEITRAPVDKPSPRIL